MDIKVEMLEIITDIGLEITSCKIHDYKGLPEKKKKNILKIDPYFNFDDFVAMIDTTISENAKDGIIFTVNGMYIAEILSQSYFINYTDIVSTDSTKGFLGKFIIMTTTSGDIEYGTTYLEKETGCSALSELLTKLQALALENNYGYSDRATGKVDKKLKLTPDEKIKANLIIHPASVAAGGVGAGLAQMPLSDAAVIVPIQIGMIISLGATFDISVTEGAAKAIITAAASGFIGRGVAQVLVGWIPGPGNVINAATATAITQSIGWIAVRHFKVVQNGGFFEGMKVGSVQAARQFEKKYRQQADEFIKKQKVYESQIDEWTKLMADYIQLIAEYETILEDKESLSKSVELKKELEQIQSLKVVQN